MKKVFLFIIIMIMKTPPAFSQDSNGYMDGGMHSMHFWGAGLIMWVLLIVGAILLIYFVSQSLKSNRSNHITQETPLDILKKRYAKGEITKEQYDQIKKDL
jgi:putative membrane protein